ncbi:MAG TPA: hypothetical protein VGH29_16295 [Candidatus Binataceae bacterium]
MARINAGRVIVGGIIAGLICFFGDGIVHGVLLRDRWAGIMTALGKSGGDVGSRHPGYFLTYDMIKGVLAVWLYAAMRPRFGPGPVTALLAAITIWLLVIPTPIIGLLPMEFFGAGFAVLWSLYGLVPIIAGTLAGAWLYREAAA